MAPAHIVRPWLNGLLAGLLAIASVMAPAQHERMMLRRAVTTLALVSEASAPPHHMHGGLGASLRRDAPAGGGHDHLALPGCFACLLMGAPGLPGVAFAGLIAPARPVGASPVAARPVMAHALAWAPQSPRAPPASLPA